MEVQSSVPKDVPHLSIITVLSNRTLFSKPSLTLIILVVLSKELSPREKHVISGVRKCLLWEQRFPPQRRWNQGPVY